jgi:hypothetical protein
MTPWYYTGKMVTLAQLDRRVALRGEAWFRPGAITIFKTHANGAPECRILPFRANRCRSLFCK